MADIDNPSDVPNNSAEKAVANEELAGGSYDLLKQRLSQQGDVLLSKAAALNAARLAEFGKEDMHLIGRVRARTEHNCVARDLVRVGEYLLFGYNVFIGLKKETQVSDVFALYKLVEHADGLDLEPVSLEGSLLTDPRFVADFRELYAYYAKTTLASLQVLNNKLLASFRIGDQITDMRVFRWELDTNKGTTGDNSSKATYIDNRGERDAAPPPAYDFAWVPTTRENHVEGRFPHVNILDTIFVETLHGDLTVKVENNTESGLGIYSEPVEDKNQSLVDAEVAYAQLGSLILLKVKPYREERTRYLVYNVRTQKVQRIDSIGQSCVQLPEDHGIVFPGGYYLQSGEFKRFDENTDGMVFDRVLRSPNGEDVLYVFYEHEAGRFALFTYNLIDKQLTPPLFANGYASFDDGRFFIFSAESGDPTRIHPMQLWQTPFTSDEFASQNAVHQGFFGRIGNAELVRGLAEVYGIGRAVQEQTPTRAAYEDLIRLCSRVVDGYFWMQSKEADQLSDDIKSIAQTARGTLDEFDKVMAIRQEANKALFQAQAEQQALLTDIASSLWQSPTDFVFALDRLSAQRGKLLMLKDLRFADLGLIDQMDAALDEEQQRVSERAVRFLSQPDALKSYDKQLADVDTAIPLASKTVELNKLLEDLDKTAQALDLLTNLLGTLAAGDATLRTQILDAISGVYSEVNRLRALGRSRRKQLGETESSAEFGAQFKLFGQSVENALELADSPEKCDESLTRLLTQLEELEGRFAEQERFVADIGSKREAVYEAFSGRKQQLLEVRQRRAQTLTEAAERILTGIPKRIAQFKDMAQLHAYFASDALIMKLKGIVKDLRDLGNAIGADDLSARLKSAQESANKILRDRSELMTDAGDVIRLGPHAFTVNTQPLDLTIVPRNVGNVEGLAFTLTGTDYFLQINDERLEALRPYWGLALLSESGQVYRAEYLAYSILEAAQQSENGLSLSALQAAVKDLTDDKLINMVREFAAPRYQEGYQKGVHDTDAAALLRALVPMWMEAGPLRYTPLARGVATLYYAQCDEGVFYATPDEGQQQVLRRQAVQAQRLIDSFGNYRARDQLVAALASAMEDFLSAHSLLEEGGSVKDIAREAAAYLAEQLSSREMNSSDGNNGWATGSLALDLADGLQRHLERDGGWQTWREALAQGSLSERWWHACNWLMAYAQANMPQALSQVAASAAVMLTDLKRIRVAATLQTRITGLLGEHSRLESDGSMTLDLNDFLTRLEFHMHHLVPAWRSLQSVRQSLIAEQRERLHLEQFQTKPLSSFVRNRLIDEVYLPLVGENLAKQMGAADEKKRTDLMGMLLLISPPGYGKTTLMEYVADRLGMIFVRINCPVLGHEVTSLDPSKAPHSAARQELEKLNLGLAMGSNVMLYLDDIQHTAPEFLQKFISLCDGTRRIDGVFQNEARTYDLRGKRFAIVMAGNPYTESGEVFKIPDMLANRADIYNLGDVLSGREALFAQSYIENSLTSHPVLAPLAGRDPADVYRFLRLAQGESVPVSEFAYSYAQAEANEIVELFKRLFRMRDVLLKVNAAYIASAAQADAYRMEPPFKLQGSYRNMSKLAAKASALMREDELAALIRDHYRGEAQTLTSGAEENLLKLAELLGDSFANSFANTQNGDVQRWNEIKADYLRNRKLGGAGADGATRVANLAADIATALDGISATLGYMRQQNGLQRAVYEGFSKLSVMQSQPQPQPVVAPTQVQFVAPDSDAVTKVIAALFESYQSSLAPTVAAVDDKVKLGMAVWERVAALSEELDARKLAAAAHSAHLAQHVIQTGMPASQVSAGTPVQPPPQRPAQPAQRSQTSPPVKKGS